MKLALLSDIHANVQALQACLVHAHENGAHSFAFLGDLVGYGANPCEVVTTVMGLATQGAWVIQGNHDAMAVHPPTSHVSMGSSTAEWTHQQLSSEQKIFLQSLPMNAMLDHLMLVHASAHDPEKWRYVDNEQAASHCLKAAQQTNDTASHVLVGHVHHQTLYYQGAGRSLMCFTPTPGVAVPLPASRPAVASVGSVGQPRDGDPRAMYAMYDTTAARLTFHRVPYDHVAAAAAIRAAGLPAFFATRLENGQ